MGRLLGSKNKKTTNAEKERLMNFLTGGGVTIPAPEAKPLPEKKKAPVVIIKGKRSTRMMYEVLPWAAQDQYKVAVTE